MFFTLDSYSQDEEGFKLYYTFDIGNTMVDINENRSSVSHTFLGVSTSVNLSSSYYLNLGLEHLSLYSDLQNDFQQFNFITVPIEVNCQLKVDNASLLIGVGLYGGCLYNVDSKISNFSNADGLTAGAIARLGGNMNVTNSI